jgi:hypothetical protein
MKKEILISLLKQPTTYMGILAVISAFFGLEDFSTEQVSLMIAGLVGVLIPEDKIKAKLKEDKK